MIATLRMPLAPTTNTSYRGGNGRFYCSDEVKVWKDEAGFILQSQKSSVDWQEIERISTLHKKKKIFTPLSLNLEFYLEHLWKSDWDGRIKMSQDLLFKFLGLDDRLVVSGHVHKLLGKDEQICIATLQLDN